MRKTRIFAPLVGLVAVMAAVLLLLLGDWLDERANRAETRGDHTRRIAMEDTIRVQERDWARRENITTILLMGVDSPEDAQHTGFRNGGQADFLCLLVIDHAQKTVTTLPIDRDTMTPIVTLGVLGNRSGTRVAQICLSHGFGDGKEMSGELTTEAVSTLLLGTKIDFYLAMNLAGLAPLNDALGGVTVTVTEDFSAFDASLTPGKTVTLMGKQAETFVRSRIGVGEGSNRERMARQRTYMNALTALLRTKIAEDEGFIGGLYDILSHFLTTDLPRGRLINEAWSARDYRWEEAAIAGSHTVGEDGFVQFHPDRDTLQNTVLTLLYRAVE